MHVVTWLALPCDFYRDWKVNLLVKNVNPPSYRVKDLEYRDRPCTLKICRKNTKRAVGIMQISAPPTNLNKGSEPVSQY